MSSPRWAVVAALLGGCTFSALVGENPRAPDVVAPVDVHIAPDVAAPVDALVAPDVAAPLDAALVDDGSGEAVVDVLRGDAPSTARDATVAPEVSLGDVALAETAPTGAPDADDDDATVIGLDVARGCVSDGDCAAVRPPSRCEAATGRCVPR